MKLRVLGILLFYSTLCFAQPQKAEETRLDDFISQTMKKDSIPGLSAVIFANKQTLWIKSYGYADRENKVPFTSHTVMNIASISKTFTGVCIMKAVEDKLVSLDEDINRYLPFRVVNPNFPLAKITLRMLGTHTSGIIDQEPYLTSYHFGGDPTESLGSWLENYFAPRGKNYRPENFTPNLPGTRYEYSNIGAALAGYIIECVTKMPLNLYSKQYIFNPLKMNDSGWLLSEIDPARHAKLYYKEDDSVELIEPYGLVTYPDGGVRTSTADLSSYFTCLLQGGQKDGIRILSEESMKTMTKAQFTSSHNPKNINIKNENFGIFWSFENGRVGHDGGDPGVDTEMFYDPKKEIGIILFVNISSDDDRKSQEIKGIPDISKKLWQYGEVIYNH